MTKDKSGSIIMDLN